MSSYSAYWFMKWSLENSNIYDSIKWRLGTALLAQESVSQWVSIPLPPDQWQLEANQLFATSLARVQYDAWSIATGEDRQRPGYVDKTPDEAKGQLCGLYKFKTLDFTNINLAAFIGLAVLAIFVFILGLDASSAWFMPRSKKEKIKVKDEEMSNSTLIIDLCVKGLKWIFCTFGCFVCMVVNRLKRRCYTCYCFICKVVREAWEKLRE
ncbi:hypothetical protein N7G274_000482 [Stereocaulon virgatum]|uniref:Uncharacterized protein n=1 Tax=Stereocaulon virgatum TaxID=373712 RepID=A0ABR4ATI3_9LECA